MKITNSIAQPRTSKNNKEMNLFRLVTVKDYPRYLLVVIMILYIQSFEMNAQYTEGPKSIKLIKSLSTSVGFIDMGLGAEARVDIPVNKIIINGTFGYKGSVTGDSVFLSPFKSINSIGDEGIFYKVGLGYKISRDEYIVKEEFKILSPEEYAYFFGSDDGYYTRNSTSGSRFETYLLFDYIHVPSGKFIQTTSTTGRRVGLFVHGYNNYFSPKLRRVRQDYTDGELTILITDVSFFFTDDFRQKGVYFEYMGIRGPFNISLGIGAIRRNDLPSNFGQFVFGKETADDYKWYIPLTVTCGFSIVTRDKTYPK